LPKRFHVASDAAERLLHLHENAGESAAVHFLTIRRSGLSALDCPRRYQPDAHGRNRPAGKAAIVGNRATAVWRVTSPTLALSGRWTERW